LIVILLFDTFLVDELLIQLPVLPSHLTSGRVKIGQLLSLWCDALGFHIQNIGAHHTCCLVQTKNYGAHKPFYSSGYTVELVKLGHEGVISFPWLGGLWLPLCRFASNFKIKLS
jgi:hypothetical protein